MNSFNPNQLILLAFTVVIVSCTWQENSKVLMASEQMMTEHSDSALNILLEVNPQTKKQRAKHALLLSMALDKNYIDVTDDSLTQLAYHYYQRHGNSHYKMLSAYYLGVVHQNAGEYLQAAIEFDEALSLAKELKDNHNAGLCCRHLSSIHAFNYNNVLALDYSKQAADYFDACGETLSADYARINIAEQLTRTENWDHAMAITDSILSRNTYTPLIRTALWLKTDILIVGKEDYKTASLILDQIPLLPQKDDSLSYYECKALLLENEGRHKEANRLFDMAGVLVSDNIDSLTLLNYISEAYKLRNDYKSAYNALREATNIQYTEIQKLLGQSVTHAMENHYRESYNTQKELTRQNTIIYSILGVLLLLIILGLILFVRKLHIDRLQDMADIESLNNDLQVLKERNEHFRKASNAVIMDKVQFLQQLSESYFSWTDEEVKKREKRYGIQTKDELISVFRQQLGEIRSDKRLIISLEEAVNSSNDNLIQRLRTEYKDKLKEEDFSTLTLLYSGLSVKSIAFYLRITEPALRTRKTRYKHFFEENPTASSAEYIQRLSNGDSSLRSE
ncbi:MAG: hypothetical protein IK113_07590 [Bacteroidales bacterium]|nr:hypothetical protein [Bacteroidales bacterium]